MLLASNSADLIVLRALRRRTAGGLEISDLSTKLAQQRTCSVVLLGEPQRSQSSVLTSPASTSVATLS